MTETHPRIYKYGPGWTAAFIGISLAFFAAAAAMVIWRDPIFGKAPYLAWISAAFFGGMGLMGLWSLKCRLILYADHVEYVGLIRRSVVRKAEILRTSGVRRTYTMLELTLELTNGRKMKVGDFGRPDDMFAEWFDAFPNAEAEAEEAQAEALLANPAFGRDEGARQKAIRGDTRLLTGLSGVGWLAGVWGLCDPRPYPLCLMILLVLPVVAFILVGLSRRRWTLGEATNGRLSLAGLGGLPAMVIGLRAMLDDGVVDWKMAAIAGGVLGLGLWILIQAIEGRLKPGALAALAIVCLAYD